MSLHLSIARGLAREVAHTHKDREKWRIGVNIHRMFSLASFDEELQTAGLATNSPDVYFDDKMASMAGS
jgi:hypothetical protein